VTYAYLNGIGAKPSSPGGERIPGSTGLTRTARSVIIPTMNERQYESPISDLLRQTIVESGVSYNALQRETGVTRASIMRFVRGSQSLRLDMADRLAAYFGLAL
jgi:hypothetical protein